MPVDAQIYTRSQAHAGLAALVATRITPEKELTGTPALPYVTFSLVSALQVYHTFSMPADFDRDDQYRFQIWAATHDSAAAVAKQIKLAFHGYLVSGTCFIVADEIEIPEDEEFVFHRVVDFRVHSQNDDA